MAKSESEAVSLFREKLRRAVSGDNIIYVISDPEHVKLLPDGAIRILVPTDLETIKERFRARMRGNLPAPVALMLERKHGMFDSGEYDYRFDGATGDAESFCVVLKNVMRDSVTPFSIRRLSQDERQTALDLAWAVFSEYESPDYPAEGTGSVRSPSDRTGNIFAFSLWTADITGAGSEQGCFGVYLMIIRMRRSPSILHRMAFHSIKRLVLCRPMKRKQLTVSVLHR